MYSISSKRRLYKSKNGWYRRIRPNDVFEDQNISVYIRAVKVYDYKPRDYIEKEIEFNQGSGRYELVFCRSRMETIYQVMVGVELLWMFITYILVRYYNKDIVIPKNLVIGCMILFVLLLLLIWEIFYYFKRNYQTYISELKNCKVIKK